MGCRAAYPRQVGLDAIAGELYALDRDAFTAARDERVRGLRADGQKHLARQVAALRRPTVAAAAVNLLARQRPDVVEALLALGPAMHRAQQAKDADALRLLGQQQRREVAVAVSEARASAAEHGARLSESAAAAVEATLRAAVADPDVATLVSRGVLEREREPGGFPGTAVWPPVSASASAPAAEGQAGHEPGGSGSETEAQVAARAALSEAESDRVAADEARSDAEQQALFAQARRDAVADELERLRVLLADAQQRVDAAERELDAARLHLAHATQMATTARARAEQLRAAAHLPEFSGSS